MNQTLIRPDRFFFGTRSLPCPYLDGQVERKVVTDLSGPNAAELYERLSRAGFRRSHGLAYRPACPSCNACIPVRIVAASFDMTKSFRRVAAANADLVADETDALATVEQYRLFSSYQRVRHEGGDMAEMTFNDYRAMVEDTPVASRTVEFRDGEGTLIAVMLMDRLEDSLSAVYSFYDGRQTRRSLGTYMILWMIERCRELHIPYVYLGYWIEASDKMAYKARFRPLEALGPQGWKTIEA
jgi:arginyl-tRNA--protein-N-Asp/Glu arginylyltransferase